MGLRFLPHWIGFFNILLFILVVRILAKSHISVPFFDSWPYDSLL